MLGTLYKFFNLYSKPCTHVTEIHDKLIILGVLLYVFSLFQSLFFDLCHNDSLLAYMLHRCFKRVTKYRYRFYFVTKVQR